MNIKETILVASGKGGVGKSSFTTNLASILSKNNHKVCIVDLDLFLGKQDLFLGLESKVKNDILDVINKKCSIEEALVKSKESENLFLLAAPRNKEHINLSSSELSFIVDELKERNFNYILLDCPAGIEFNSPFRTAVKCSDRAIILTNPEKTALRDADSVISILENNEFNSESNIHLVITKYIEPSFISKKGILNTNEIQKTLAIPLLGIVHFDNNNSIAVNTGKPVIYVNSKSYQDYKHIYYNLLKLNNSDSKKLKLKKKFKLL